MSGQLTRWNERMTNTPSVSLKPITKPDGRNTKDSAPYDSSINVRKSAVNKRTAMIFGDEEVLAPKRKSVEPSERISKPSHIASVIIISTVGPRNRLQITRDAGDITGFISATSALASRLDAETRSSSRGRSAVIPVPSDSLVNLFEIRYSWREGGIMGLSSIQLSSFSPSSGTRIAKLLVGGDFKNQSRTELPDYALVRCCETVSIVIDSGSPDVTGWLHDISTKRSLEARDVGQTEPLRALNISLSFGKRAGNPTVHARALMMLLFMRNMGSVSWIDESIHSSSMSSYPCSVWSGGDCQLQSHDLFSRWYDAEGPSAHSILLSGGIWTSLVWGAMFRLSCPLNRIRVIHMHYPCFDITRTLLTADWCVDDCRYMTTLALSMLRVGTRLPPGVLVCLDQRQFDVVSSNVNSLALEVFMMIALPLAMIMIEHVGVVLNDENVVLRIVRSKQSAARLHDSLSSILPAAGSSHLLWIKEFVARFRSIADDTTVVRRHEDSARAETEFGSVAALSAHNMTNSESDAIAFVSESNTLSVTEQLEIIQNMCPESAIGMLSAVALSPQYGSLMPVPEATWSASMLDCSLADARPFDTVSAVAHPHLRPVADGVGDQSLRGSRVLDRFNKIYNQRDAHPDEKDGRQESFGILACRVLLASLLLKNETSRRVVATSIVRCMFAFTRSDALSAVAVMDAQIQHLDQDESFVKLTSARVNPRTGTARLAFSDKEKSGDRTFSIEFVGQA